MQYFLEIYFFVMMAMKCNGNITGLSGKREYFLEIYAVHEYKQYTYISRICTYIFIYVYIYMHIYEYKHVCL